jgi:hypothetical protein
VLHRRLDDCVPRLLDLIGVLGRAELGLLRL